MLLSSSRPSDDTKVNPPLRSPTSSSGEVDDYVAEKAAATHVLVNMSAGPVDVALGDGHVLHLAPLERRKITRRETSRIDPSKVRRSRYVKIDRMDDGLLRPRAAQALRFVAVAVVLLPVVGVLVLGPLGMLHLLDGLWFAVAALVAVAALILGGSYVLAPSVGGWRAYPDLLREVRTKVAHHASYYAVVIAAVVIPGMSTWYLGGFRGAMQGVTTARGAASALDNLFVGPDNTALAMAWLLQLVLISSASVLPALLFFVFDRTQLGTLKHQLLRHIFRLETDLETLSDVDAKYGPQIAETFGSGPKNYGRFAAGTRLPVVFATILIAAGWTVLMITTDHGSSTDAAQAGFRLISFWSSPPDLVGYAFLGAYVFALRLTLRGYMRGDLRTKAYSEISVRLLTVVVLAWLLREQVSPDTATSGPWLAAGFFGGFFPDELMQWLKEFIGRPRLTRRRANPKWPAIPTNDLHTLAGLDAYDRSRLAQEGINNVQGLAKADLVTLLMNVRVPADRLFDWVDQAVLQLHVGPCCDATNERENGADGESARARALRRRLSVAGIRTATQVAAQDAPDDDAEWKVLNATLNADRTVQALLDFLTPQHYACTPGTSAARRPMWVDAAASDAIREAGNGQGRTASRTARRLWLPTIAADGTTWTTW